MTDAGSLVEEIVAGWHMAGAKRQVLIQCAHYALFWKEAHAVDCFEWQQPSDLPTGYFSRFAMNSGALGLQLARALRAAGAEVRLCVLVNDWQYLESSRSLLPMAQRARSAYFDRVTMEVPASLRACLLEEADETLLHGGAWRHALKSESGLRHRFVRRVLAMDTAQLARLGLVKGSTSDGNPTFELRRDDIDGEPIAPGICLVYGGNTNCAGEVIELLCEIDESDTAACFINLFPVECENHVNIGTRIYQHLREQAPPLSVINVALASEGQALRSRVAYA